MNKSIPLQVSGVSKRFDKVQAVSNLSFTVQAGDVLGIVGPNGAGKTTTLKMILGLIEPDEGSIELFGASVTDSAVRQRIGSMPETPSFYNHLTGAELVRLAGELFGLSKTVLAKKVPELLKMVGLQNAADRQLHTYSKGMLQRVCLAQALINNPELLFLDEPLDGLDPLGRIQMKEILLNIRATGTAVVLNSHILSDVAAISTHIAIMHNGVLLKLEPTSKLIPAGKSLEDVFLATIQKEEA